MEWRAKVELFEEIRREYEFGVGTIGGVAHKLSVHRRMVSQALADAWPPERKRPARTRPVLAQLIPFIMAPATLAWTGRWCSNFAIDCDSGRFRECFAGKQITRPFMINVWRIFTGNEFGSMRRIIVSAKACDTGHPLSQSVLIIEHGGVGQVVEKQ